MKVVIHYATVGPSGGMLTLTEDVSAMPRLPEVGEKIVIKSAWHGGRTYKVESIDWIVENTSNTGSRIGTLPIYEVTMNIRCRAGSS